MSDDTGKTVEELLASPEVDAFLLACFVNGAPLKSEDLERLESAYPGFRDQEWGE